MLKSTEKSASISWLTLLRRSQGESMGGGIERLARLAAVAHQQSVAEQVACDTKADRGEVKP